MVFGATGFVGSAVMSALSARGLAARSICAPRLAPIAPGRARDAVQENVGIITQLQSELAGATAVVNAAGVAAAGSKDEALLTSANAVWPAVLAQAARQAGVDRFIHVSSAAVQGNSPRLDSTEHVAPFSAYSRSKVAGELLVHETLPEAIIYRPPGVHALNRPMTHSLARIARSRFACVAGDGSTGTPQALVGNVADAIVFLAVSPRLPPAIVAHPSEGMTTSSLLRELGGHEPRYIPTSVAAWLIRTAALLGRFHDSLAANARRLDIVWLGQDQDSSWLTEAGWTPPEGGDAWTRLGVLLRSEPQD